MEDLSADVQDPVFKVFRHMVEHITEEHPSGEIFALADPWSRQLGFGCACGELRTLRLTDIKGSGYGRLLATPESRDALAAELTAGRIPELPTAPVSEPTE